ncbi:MAG TPA: hypothetical protein VFF76_09760 [Holophagaceae bacterium]|jgi:hypothetical protein|nr:hypothetical protein [Holophagaceae bacterium]
MPIGNLPQLKRCETVEEAAKIFRPYLPGPHGITEEEAKGWVLYAVDHYSMRSSAPRMTNAAARRVLKKAEKLASDLAVVLRHSPVVHHMLDDWRLYGTNPISEAVKVENIAAALHTGAYRRYDKDKPLAVAIDPAPLRALALDLGHLAFALGGSLAPEAKGSLLKNLMDAALGPLIGRMGNGMLNSDPKRSLVWAREAIQGAVDWKDGVQALEARIAEHGPGPDGVDAQELTRLKIVGGRDHLPFLPDPEQIRTSGEVWWRTESNRREPEGTQPEPDDYEVY